MKELIDRARASLTKLEDYDTIFEQLQSFKDESTVLLMGASHTIFDEQYIKVEDFINEHTSGPFKHDTELQQEIGTFLQLMTDWKVEMRVHLAKSPLLEDPV